MLSRELLRKYSPVLSFITASRGLPYRWNPLLQEMRFGNRPHLTLWLLLMLHTWSNFLFLSTRLLLHFSSISTPFRAFHVLWILANSFQGILQLCLLFQSQEILDFTNLLTKESKVASERFRRMISSRKEAKRQEALLELILFSFAGAAVGGPTIVLGIFFFDPLQSQFLFGSLPQTLQSNLFVFLLCGVYEASWLAYIWLTSIFFLFLEIPFFFLLQTLLKNYRKKLPGIFGTHRWILEYRSLQLFQNRFNSSVGKYALPAFAISFLAFSLITNYGAISFFHIRQQLSLPFYLAFPLSAAFVSTFELVLYPWIASIHALSTSIHRQSSWRNPGGFSRELSAKYARSLVPLQVKICPLRRISKSTILAVLTFTFVSTARLVILLPSPSI